MFPWWHIARLPEISLHRDDRRNSRFLEPLRRLLPGSTDVPASTTVHRHALVPTLRQPRRRSSCWFQSVGGVTLRPALGQPAILFSPHSHQRFSRRRPFGMNKGNIQLTPDPGGIVEHDTLILREWTNYADFRHSSLAICFSVLSRLETSVDECVSTCALRLRIVNPFFVA